MAKKNDYFASPRKDGVWVVKSSNTRRTASVYSTKAGAWQETRRLARGAGSIAILREKDGNIVAQNVYDLDSGTSQEL